MFGHVIPLLVLASSQAGNSDDANLDAALEVLRAGAEVEVATSDTPEELDSVLDKARDRVLVVAGGDGSFHTILAALRRRGELSDAVVGLLPLGTGNDFARGLEIPLDPAEAARVVLRDHRRRLDVLVETGTPVDDHEGTVVNAVHAGAGAQAARAGEGWKKRLGRIGYPIGALITAFNPPALKLDIEVDGEPLTAPSHGRLLQIAVGVGSSVGGGTQLLPDADPGDRLADLMVAYAVTPGARIGYAARLLRGKHPTHRDVVTRRCRTVTVRGEEFWCSNDGELTGPHTQQTWRVEPSAYTMLVP